MLLPDPAVPLKTTFSCLSAPLNWLNRETVAFRSTVVGLEVKLKSLRKERGIELSNTFVANVSGYTIAVPTSFSFSLF